MSTFREEGVVLTELTFRKLSPLFVVPPPQQTFIVSKGLDILIARVIMVSDGGDKEGSESPGRV